MTRPPKRPSEPARLGASDADLKRAFDLLANDGAPSAAELQRMRQQLMVVFESPAPPLRPLLTRLRVTLGGIGLGGLLLVGAMGLWQIARPAAVVSKPSTTSLPGETTETSSARTDAPSDQTTSQRVALDPTNTGVTPATPIKHVPGKSRHSQPATPRGAMSKGPAAAPSSEARSSTTSAPSATTRPAEEVTTSPASTQPSASVSLTAPAERAAARERSTAAPAPPPLDEATLLHRARQIASSDPDASLRLLDEHRRRFTNGMLTPEREVFTIELLRSLSRTEEANRRLQTFRRSYPDSVYLQRLER